MTSPNFRVEVTCVVCRKSFWPQCLNLSDIWKTHDSSIACSPCTGELLTKKLTPTEYLNGIMAPYRRRPEKSIRA